jgi:uncharacterized MAPEG superfamily protein
MPIELKMLVWSAALALVQVMIAAAAAQSKLGLPVLAGNRENMPPLTGFALRASRAHANLLESLTIFAIVVLVAHATGHLNAATALGAQLFFWARVAYAVVYLAGIPWVRSAVWAVSIAGILLIMKELF